VHKTAIQPERLAALNDRGLCEGGYVLYWLQQAQRAEYNHALEYAAEQANALAKPLLVAFGLTDGYPEANRRHYHFMLEGLQDVEAALHARGVRFVVQRGAPDEVALRLAQRASLIVCDRGYLRVQRAWRERVAREAPCRVVQVESDVVVPVELASSKKEHAARTLRPRLTKHLARFLVALPETRLEHTSLDLEIAGEDLSDVDALVGKLELEQQVPPVRLFRGGTRAAKRVLAAFLAEDFARYAATRNQPQTNFVSHMSKYLHFGQISPVYIALEVRAAGMARENTETYLEELIVRRELPMNYVFYEPDYDRYSALPEWARRTLDEHRHDARDPQYTRAQLEAAETEDPYWNAAMQEMKVTGYMHNYMRMYWGKKILEWSAAPETAFETALYLNNKYFLDGRDANSFANVAWVFGQHDRGWAERAVYGKVRYLSKGGLERKADPEAYVKKVRELIEAEANA
jgi:deoxyribodipyrimidine photo-lyase